MSSTIRRFCATVIATAIVASAVGQNAQAAVRYHFDVPAQPLGDAIRTLASQADTNVMFDETLLKGHRTQRLQMEATLDEALNWMLTGTGLTARWLNERTVVVAATSHRDSKTQAEHHELKLLRGQGAKSPFAESGAQIKQTAAREFSDRMDHEPAFGSRQSEQDDVAEVLVTGSHIRGVSPTSPVITLDRSLIERSGHTNVGDVIRTLPQNFGGGNNPQVITGAAPGPDNITYSGGSAPNLRGLGSSSTLTLVNGHRLAQDTTKGATDISLIPIDAIERVEVVTDGASAAYGSDAVAGVINFILRKRYDGAQSSASIGKATDGGALERRFSQLLGTSWQDGGVVFVYERALQDAVDATEREFSSTARAPYSLLPSSSRNSFYISANQDLTQAVSVLFNGLYTSRESHRTASYPPSFYFKSPVEQYETDVGVKVALPGKWQAKLFGSSAEQSTDYDSFLFTPGSEDLTSVGRQSLEGKTRSVELNADGPLLNVGAGDWKLSFGAGYREDHFSIADVMLSQAFAIGKRGVRYVFGEIAIPMVEPSSRVGIRRLDLIASGRYENYSDFGGESVPKIGVAYMPTDSVQLRGSWGKSFRAPSIYDVYGLRRLSQIILTDPFSESGTATVLYPSGGNPNLEPETSTSWTIGIDYSSGADGLNVGLTYYEIDYRNRIAQISNLFSALSDVANAPFVTRSPSLELLETLFANANGGFFNSTTVPYDPSNIAAIVDFRPLNIARQRIRGIDFVFDYGVTGALGDLGIFLNSAYLDLRQQVTAVATAQQLAGTAFNPPRFRARAGATWSKGAWALTTTVNYLDDEVNTYLPSRPKVASWTTIDLQLAFNSPFEGLLKDVRSSLQVHNLLNRNPPSVEFDEVIPGFRYDAVNATPLGRFVSLQLVKSW